MKNARRQRKPSSRKEDTHRRIVDAAARSIRATGYDGTGVADIMKSVELTTAVSTRISVRGRRCSPRRPTSPARTALRLWSASRRRPALGSLQALIRADLSKAHADGVAIGCPVVALGSEMPRQAPEVRRAATRRIKEFIDLVARQSPDWGLPGAHERALVTVSTMVGALLLARAVDDPKLAGDVREAALSHLTSQQS